MSKEWLEEIRKLLVNLYNAVDVDEEMKHYIFNDLKIEWLIEQAERVNELEQQNKRYREVLEEIARGRLPGASYKARKALEGKRMSDKECEEFVCDYCGTELDETDEYHTTFHTCDKDCYMKMVGLSWSDFI